MKRISIIAMLALAFASCSRKDSVGNPDPGPGSSPLNSRMKTSASSSNLSEFFYDAQGRIVKKTSSDGSKQEWVYSPGKVVRNDFKTNGSLDYFFTFDLNAEGRVIKRTISNNASYQDVVVYNPDGTEAKSIFTILGDVTTRDFFYSNGNCDSIRAAKNGNWIFTVVYTYHLDKSNVLANQIYGENYHGKANKNLLKSETYNYFDGTSTPLSTFDYEFDSNGRVIKLKSAQGGNLNISLYTYY